MIQFAELVVVNQPLQEAVVILSGVSPRDTTIQIGRPLLSDNVFTPLAL